VVQPYTDLEDKRRKRKEEKMRMDGGRGVWEGKGT
jgi:hypothetical protein